MPFLYFSGLLKQNKKLKVYLECPTFFYSARQSLNVIWWDQSILVIPWLLLSMTIVLVPSGVSFICGGKM